MNLPMIYYSFRLWWRLKWHQKYTPDGQDIEVLKYIWAQQVLDSWSNTEGGLVTRDILPATSKEDWRPPPNPNYSSYT